VTVELEAPPPSPSVYMDMGSVSSSHYLRLQDQSEGEEESVVFMDAVSTPSVPSVFYPCSIYNSGSSCCLSNIKVRFSGAEGGEPESGPEIYMTFWKNNF
jgi:hypothetical protein